MAEITAALDEGGANKLLDAVIAAIGTRSLPPGTGTLGPFTATYAASGTLTNGNVDLIPPDTIRIADLRLDWTVTLSFVMDLAAIMPKLCLPRACIDTPCGRVCTPEICVPWPKRTVNVTLSDFVETTVDTRLKISLVAGVWRVEAEILDVPDLTIGLKTGAILIALSAAITPVLLTVPLIGPFLAVAVNIILTAIGVAAVFGLLGPILSMFVSGLTFKLYEQPKLFQVLPPEGPFDPKVDFNIDALNAFVAHNSPEDELVLTADISP
jgi:hypothetical protein